MRRLASIGLLFLVFAGCNPNRRTPAVVELKSAPTFNEDSAYHFIEQQLAFGPRIPGLAGHDSCGNFLANTLTRYGFEVTEQKDTIVVYADRMLPLRNIQGSINPELGNRMLLCAHWDSRHIADQDDEDSDQPIEGANDNASGVAILLEMARCMAQRTPEVGVDIVFFDMEDQGRPASDNYDDPLDHGYCRGSYYWSNRADSAKYRFGILLDMVGAKDAIFTLDANSMHHASEVVYTVWDMGHQLGFGHHFQYNRTWEIMDDHANLNQFAKIPSIDIIQHEASTASRFGEYWHTHDDNVSIIDRETLKAVGQTVLQVVYNEPKP